MAEMPATRLRVQSHRFHFAVLISSHTWSVLSPSQTGPNRISTALSPQKHFLKSSSGWLPMSLNRGLTTASKLLTVALASEKPLLFLAALGALGSGRLCKALLTHDSSSC